MQRASHVIYHPAVTKTYSSLNFVLFLTYITCIKHAWDQDKENITPWDQVFSITSAGLVCDFEQVFYFSKV